MSFVESLPDGRRGQGLAVLLGLLAVALVWLGIVAPVLDFYQARAEKLALEQAFAGRAASIAAALPALKQQAEGDDNDADDQNGPTLLTGNTDAIAAASLQQKIDDIASRQDLNFESEEILPATQEGSLRAIRVRVTLSAPWKSLVGLLSGLALAEVPMVMGDLQLRGPPRTLQKDDLPISASMTITSWRVAASASQ